MFKADVFEVPCGTEKSSKILGGVCYPVVSFILPLY